MKKRPLPGSSSSSGHRASASASASIADTIARVSGLATRALLEPSDEDVARLLALEARRRGPTVGGHSHSHSRLLSGLMGGPPAGQKPNVNKQFLANTIRSVSSHNRREEEAECWRAHGVQKRLKAAEAAAARGGRRDRSRSRSRSRVDEEHGDGSGHVPLRPPPAPRLVPQRAKGKGNDGDVGEERWERGVGLSPPPPPIVTVGSDDGSTGSPSSSSSSSSSSDGKEGRKRARKEQDKKRKRKKESDRKKERKRRKEEASKEKKKQKKQRRK